MSRTEQYKDLIKDIVDNCDNVNWLDFTLSFLASLYDKRVIRGSEKLFLADSKKGGATV